MSFNAQDLVDECYTKCGAPAVIVDTTARLIAFSLQPSDIADEHRLAGLINRNREGIAAFGWLVAQVKPGDAFVRTAADTSHKLAPRIVVPLYAHGVAVAYFMAIDAEERVTVDDVERWKPLLAAVALEIEFERTDSFHRRAVLSTLLSSGEDARRQAADALAETYSLDNRRPIRVVVAHIVDDRDDAPTPVRWELTPGSKGVVAAIDNNLVAILPDDHALTEMFCDRIESIRTFRRHLPAIGVGGSILGLDQAYRSYRQAKRALSLSVLKLRRDSVVHWDRLGSWRALLMLQSSDAIEAIDPRVKCMLDKEDDLTIALVHDYLERAGDVASIATAQHVHRTTIYGRLKRLAGVYGIDWNSADDQATILIGIRMAGLHGLRPFSSRQQSD